MQPDVDDMTAEEAATFIEEARDSGLLSIMLPIDAVEVLRRVRAAEMLLDQPDLDPEKRVLVAAKRMKLIEDFMDLLYKVGDFVDHCRDHHANVCEHRGEEPDKATPTETAETLRIV